MRRNQKRLQKATLCIRKKEEKDRDTVFSTE